MIEPHTIGAFVKENIMGCKFVGVSDTNEVFVEFEHDDVDLELGASQRLQREFPQISKVIVVVKPSIAQVRQMVEDLNQFLVDTPKKGLLDIEEF